MKTRTQMIFVSFLCWIAALVLFAFVNWRLVIPVLLWSVAMNLDHYLMTRELIRAMELVTDADRVHERLP